MQVNSSTIQYPPNAFIPRALFLPSSHCCLPQKNRIIHYDLKPANVLIHRGEVTTAGALLCVTRLTRAALQQVKITDFGLSKVMSEEEHQGGGMELTSQVRGLRGVVLQVIVGRLM